MNVIVAQILHLLNALTNTVGSVLLAPVPYLPGWLSLTLASVVTGILLLVVFKYTSNQKAIKRVRDDISADLLALKLFKESARVAFVSQGRILVAAGRLMLLAIVPMLVMFVPVCLVLGQLSLYYQARPLKPNEDVVLTVRLNSDPDTSLPEVTLTLPDGIENTLGPVRAPSQRAVFWSLRGAEAGHYLLTVSVAHQTTTKEFVVSEHHSRVSLHRPELYWYEVLVHPAEHPFGPDSPIRSIEIDYPKRDGWLSGTDAWIITWFIISVLAGFCLRRTLGVQV